MQIINRTPFGFAHIHGRIGFPKHSLTLIVKGTFDLTSGAEVTIAEQQRPPTGDEFPPEDEEMQGAPRYESDFAYFKPRADLLLSGHCHAPDGREVRSLTARFEVGAHSRAVRVFGDRQWVGIPGFRSIEDPVPFKKMPLGYDRSFGGEGYKANPSGLGYGSDESESGDSIRPLPNLETPDDPIRSTRSRPEPAGFGPLGRFWKDRGSRLGTYKKAWLKTRWPWLPEDFDFGHYNAAHPSMQVEGYLRGDETVRLENLHPEHARLETRLPGIRMRAFVSEVAPEAGGEGPFREIPLELDTLHVDGDAAQLILVWRGIAEVRDDKYQEVEHVFLTSEPLGEAATSLADCRALFLQTLAELEAEFAEEEEEPEGESPAGATPEPPEPPEPPISVAEARASVDAQLGAIFAMSGFDPESLPPEARAKLESASDDAAREIASEAVDVESAALRTQMDEALSKLGIDPANLPAPSDAAVQQQVSLLAELGLPDVGSMLADPEAVMIVAGLAAAFGRAGMNPENLGPVIAKARALMGDLSDLDEEEPEAEPEEARLPWTRERVEVAAREGESFAGESLAGLDLSGLDLKGCDFSQADLSQTRLGDADLSEAILPGVDLTGADCSGAKFCEATAAGADLSGAILTGADFALADLAGAKFSGSVFTDVSLNETTLSGAELAGADLSGIEAPEALLDGANLTGANLAGANLAGADLSGAALASANLKGANLAEASLEGASCAGADFAEADLTKLRASSQADFSGCCFEQARGAESTWEGANLSRADFSHAEMEGALFFDADLTDANLYASNMKYARFPGATLLRARFVEMNLFEGSFEKANLAQADLSGSNLYGVEFLEADLTDTVTTGANVEMTKLA